MHSVAQEFLSLISRIDERSKDRDFSFLFWDGSKIPPEQKNGEENILEFTSPGVLAYILQAPGELGWSRAWVTGQVQIHGDLGETLRSFERWKKSGWHISDTTQLPRLAKKYGAFSARPPKPQSEIILDGRLHSLSRDRSAIKHHYDLSNQFYKTMLGPSMVYSCAYFQDQAESLADAQERKLHLVCRKLELQPGDTLLDIGCGWGALIVHAAKHYGVQATGVTLSDKQLRWAKDWIQKEGLERQCQVQLQDYRDIQTGPYQKIASIGMFEHVGRRNLWLYLSRARDLLAPGGLFLNHGIVRTNQVKENKRSFSRRFVFPDGELLTQGEVISHFESAGFELLDDESLRPHYAQTLRCWQDNMQQNKDQIIQEIGREKERIWRLHNAGAAIAFQDERLSIHQALLRALGSHEHRPLRTRPCYAEHPRP